MMTNKRIRVWELERFLLGELSSSRMEEIAKLAAENPDIQREIDELKRAGDEILKRHTPGNMLPGILKKVEEENRRGRAGQKSAFLSVKRLLYAAPVLAAAVILAFVVLNKNGPAPGDTRIKGDEPENFVKAQILIYRKNGAGIERLNDQDRGQAGDLLQIAYAPSGKTYGVIFSIDGRGVVTLHFPEKKGDSCLLKPEKKSLLSTAYELDKAPDFERFFFITSMTDIDVERVMRQAEALALSPASAKTAALDLPESYDQFSMILNKEKK